MEPPEEYSKMAELVPLLSHLQPPSGFSRISLGRYSNHHDRAAEFGFNRVGPIEAYRYIYPSVGDSVERLAQFFDYGYAGGQDPKTYAAPLAKAIRDWRDTRFSSALLFIDDPVRPFLWDTRPVARSRLTLLNALQKCILCACEAQTDIARIREFLQEKMREDISEAIVSGELEAFIEKGLVIRDGEKYLGLAVCVGPEKKNAVLGHIETVLARDARDAGFERLRKKIRLIEIDGEARIGAGELKNSLSKFSSP